jgi:hypothetical protein
MQFRLRPMALPPENAVLDSEPGDAPCERAGGIHPGQFLHVGYTPWPSPCGSGYVMFPLYTWACIPCSN